MDWLFYKDQLAGYRHMNGDPQLMDRATYTPWTVYPQWLHYNTAQR